MGSAIEGNGIEEEREGKEALLFFPPYSCIICRKGLVICNLDIYICIRWMDGRIGEQTTGGAILACSL